MKEFFSLWGFEDAWGTFEGYVGVLLDQFFFPENFWGKLWGAEHGVSFPKNTGSNTKYTLED